MPVFFRGLRTEVSQTSYHVDNQMPKKNQSPLQSDLFPGALRTSIVHSIGMARLPGLQNERSWDGINYSMQDSMATRGTITFDGNTFVGVFRNDKSESCPQRSGRPYDIEVFLKGMPSDLRKLAENEALQFVLDRFEGKVFPSITTAFWGDGKAAFVQAAEPWSNVLSEGGKIAAVDFMPDSKAYSELFEYYGLDESFLELAKSLHKRKLEAGNNEIEISKDEQKQIKSIAKGEKGFDTSRKAFGQFGIRFPG
jgi:hypothetical protein